MSYTGSKEGRPEMALEPLTIDFMVGVVAQLLDHDREIDRIHGPDDSQKRYRDGEINGLAIVHKMLLGGLKVSAQTYADILTGKSVDTLRAWTVSTNDPDDEYPMI